MSIPSWVVRPRPNPQAKLRLFCFPYAGGGTATYRSWPAGLPDSIELCLIQLPGREYRLREPLYSHPPDLIQALGEALSPFVDKPYALLGHSMGALLAFESARLFRREGLPLPLHLIVSGSKAPQIHRIGRTYDLPDEEFLKDLQSLNGTPREVLDHPELMAMVLPMLRADFQIVQTYAYTPEPPLDCPISAFGGLKDTEVSREELNAWREQTVASFSIRMLEGDHFFLRSAQAVLLQMISRIIDNLVAGLSQTDNYR